MISSGAPEADRLRPVEPAAGEHQLEAHFRFLRPTIGVPVGAFGNEPEWIHSAMRRALKRVVDVGLDVRVVSYGKPDPALERLVAEFG